MLTREAAFAKLLELRRAHTERSASLCEANEATTRLLIVDEVLSLMGWDKQEFNPESKVGLKSFTDYSLSSTGVTRLIVEAKRLSHTFASPKSILRRTEYDLTYMQSAFGPALGEVLGQAKKYCELTRVPFAVLTNGAEWIVAQLIPPPGRSVTDLRCYYAGNILHEDSHFDTLWQLISKQSVIQGNLEEAFDELNRLECEFSQSPRSTLGDWAGLSSPISQTLHLRDFYERFFDEIVDPQRRTMLDHCYVTSAKLEQYESAMKRTLEDSAPRYLDGAQELAPGDTQRILGSPSGDRKGRVVLIVGSVGVGKTTFVTRVIRTQRSDKLAFTLLNLIDDANLTLGSLWDKLATEIKHRNPSWCEHSYLKKVFHKQLEAQKRGPMAVLFSTDQAKLVEAEALLLQREFENPSSFVTGLFRYLAKGGTSNAVFLDNVDRLAESVQRDIYSFAHKVATETGAAVIMSMRETTYYRAKEEGFLDVRSSDVVFHLQAPDLVQIVAKRVKYAEFQLNDPQGDDKDLRLKAWKSADTWESFRTSALVYAAEIKKSLLQSNQSQSVVGLFAAVAWHNVRRFFRALRHTHQLLTHARSDWAMEAIVGSLMIAEDGAATPFLTPTLFESPAPRHLAHFARLRLVAYLLSGVNQWEAKAGISYDRLLSFMRAYGYRKTWIDSVIVALVRERLLECLEIPASPDFTSEYKIVESHTFRCSPLAVVVLRDLQFQRVYLAAAGWSLSFLDEEYFGEFVSAAEPVKATAASKEELPVSALLAESSLADVTVSYLYSTLEDEQIRNESLRSQQDFMAVEAEVRRVRERWEGMVPELSETRVEPTSEGGSSSVQTTLPLPAMEEPGEFVPVGKPVSFGSAKLDGSSRLGALVLWALVCARANRQMVLSGSQIAAIINRYAVGEHRAVLGTNVSRALRSAVMASQHWLRIDANRGQHPRYSLAPGWEDSWRRTFSEEPPKVA